MEFILIYIYNGNYIDIIQGLYVCRKRLGSCDVSISRLRLHGKPYLAFAPCRICKMKASNFCLHGLFCKNGPLVIDSITAPNILGDPKRDPTFGNHPHGCCEAEYSLPEALEACIGDEALRASFSVYYPPPNSTPPHCGRL